MSIAAPRALVVVAGTATEIGKTWVSVELARALVADGWSVAARKPAQSGVPGEVTDADLLAGATGEPGDVVCPEHRRYSVAMAPPMAAEALGLAPPTVAELEAEVAGSWGGRAADLALVELAGGIASPAASDGDGADLAAAVGPDIVLLVADAGLGTINSVRLSAARLLGAGLPAPVVVLNRYDATDDLHVRNREWLTERDGLAVVSSPGDLAELAATWIPRHCGSCGRVATECDGSCARPLDPDRHCVRCGRRLVVVVTPMSHTARCRVHGSACT